MGTLDIRKTTSNEVRTTLMVGGLYLVSIIAWSYRNGALGIPRNDDGFYLRTAFHFASTGDFVPVSSYPMLFGQVLISLPVIKIFGESIAALQVFWASIAVLALVALYMMFREFLSSLHAAICVFALALGPIFANLSLSYMTDLPAFSFQVFGMFCISKAFSAKHKNFAWMTTSLLLIAIAFTVRQSSIFMLAVFSIVLFVNFKIFSRSKELVALLSLTVGGLALFYFWRSGLAEFGEFSIDLSGFRNPVELVGKAVLQSGMTYGIYVFPLVLIISPLQIYKNFSKISLYLSLGASLLIAASFAVVRPKPGGNYFSQFVAYQAANSASSYDILYAWEWQLLQLIGLICTVAFVIVCGRWFVLRRSSPEFRNNSFMVVGVSLLLLFAFQVVAFGGGGFDRYGILLIPLAGAIFLKCANDQKLLTSRFKAASLVYCVLVLILGVRAFDASTNFDGAGWEIAQQQVDNGSDPLTIDGGYSWFAFYQTNFETVEIDKFALWFKFRESSPTLTMSEKQIIDQICYVTRIGDLGTNSKARELEVSGLFGWKARFELQKKDGC